MADPLSPGPTVTDPELEAQLIRLLSIRGTLGSLKVLDTVVPVVSLGDVVTPEIDIRTPAYRSTDIFSTGLQVNQAANTILADTGALPAGTYDVIFHGAADATIASASIVAQHRDAANAANLAVWDYLVVSGGGNAVVWEAAFGYELALNERLRLLQTIAPGAARTFSGVIFARIRS